MLLALLQRSKFLRPAGCYWGVKGHRPSRWPSCSCEREVRKFRKLHRRLLSTAVLHVIAATLRYSIDAGWLGRVRSRVTSYNKPKRVQVNWQAASSGKLAECRSALTCSRAAAD